jgi:hypothetical protein
VTKRTPLEQFHAATLDALEKTVDEAEKTRLAETDPALSREQRLRIFKSLQAWPRIVLGLYQAELAVAQRQKQENGAQQPGEPSDIAYEIVGKALGVGPDRIRHLCREGRCHLRQGMPARPEIRAAEFKRKLSFRQRS